MLKLSEKISEVRIFEKYVYVPEADGMPFDRWHAYMMATALSSGYHGRFSIGTFNKKSRITVYETISLH